MQIYFWPTLCRPCYGFWHCHYRFVWIHNFKWIGFGIIYQLYTNILWWSDFAGVKMYIYFYDPFKWLLCDSFVIIQWNCVATVVHNYIITNYIAAWNLQFCLKALLVEHDQILRFKLCCIFKIVLHLRFHW